MKLSVIIPALNEAANVGRVIEAVVCCAQGQVASLEIIVVDDHSDDDTFGVVAALPFTQVKVLRLSRQSGSHVALRAGLLCCTGDAALCLSADGQDDPSVLGAILEKWRSGSSIVWALRRRREGEPLLNRLFALAFYRVLDWFGEGGEKIDLSRADFYLLSRPVVDAINRCPERNTSLFGLIRWLGFAQSSVEYARRERYSGQSKWNLKSRLRLASDWIIAFSGVPLRLIAYAGALTAALGFLYAADVIFNKVVFNDAVSGWSSVMTVILIVGGVQMVMLGVIGEYLWRNLDESRKRPAFFIERAIGVAVEDAWSSISARPHADVVLK